MAWFGAIYNGGNGNQTVSGNLTVTGTVNGDKFRGAAKSAADTTYGFTGLTDATGVYGAASGFTGVPGQLNVVTVSGTQLQFSGHVYNASTATQSITAATNTILANGSNIKVSSNANYLMTSAPTIADGAADGLLLRIVNVGANNVQLQDQGTLASSNLRLTAASITLGPRDSVDMMWSTTVGDWIQVGNVVSVL